MGTPVSLGDSLGPLPWELVGGMALSLLDRKLTLSADQSYEHHTYFAETRLGAEYVHRVSPVDVALRGGYVVGARQDAGGLAGFTLGAGIGARVFSLDYAWQPVGDFGNSHKVSVTYTFD
jgi:hypothetical protein